MAGRLTDRHSEHYTYFLVPSGFPLGLQLLHPSNSYRPLHIHAARLGLQLMRRRLMRGIFLRILWRGQEQGTSKKGRIKGTRSIFEGGMIRGAKGE